MASGGMVHVKEFSPELLNIINQKSHAWGKQDMEADLENHRCIWTIPIGFISWTKLGDYLSCTPEKPSIFNLVLAWANIRNHMKIIESEFSCRFQRARASQKISSEKFKSSNSLALPMCAPSSMWSTLLQRFSINILPKDHLFLKKWVSTSITSKNGKTWFFPLPLRIQSFAQKLDIILIENVNTWSDWLTDSHNQFKWVAGMLSISQTYIETFRASSSSVFF